jgi:hypothetical protein
MTDCAEALSDDDIQLARFSSFFVRCSNQRDFAAQVCIEITNKPVPQGFRLTD